MTRKQIESEYKVINGVIRSLGKFEAEPVYAPYFYDVLLNGGGEAQDEDGVVRFEITPEDITMFPELSGYSFALLDEDSQGFVYVEVCT
jgi:hypothetical protein